MCACKNGNKDVVKLLWNHSDRIAFQSTSPRVLESKHKMAKMNEIDKMDKLDQIGKVENVERNGQF